MNFGKGNEGVRPVRENPLCERNKSMEKITWEMIHGVTPVPSPPKIAWRF